MKASFIIRFHSKRLDNLNQTLRFLEKWHRSVISESQLVLVCQDSTDRIANGFERYDHFNLELDCMRLPRLTNFGVEKSLAEKIVLLDGDRIAPAGYYQRILDQLEKGKIFSIKTSYRATACSLVSRFRPTRNAIIAPVLVPTTISKQSATFNPSSESTRHFKAITDVIPLDPPPSRHNILRPF